MKLINGFCCYIDIFMIYDGKFDQFGVLWKIKILGLVLNPIWGFCSIGLKLIKLACWIDVIDHSKLFSNLCDDQLINFFKNIQVVLKFLGFLLETLCSSQFCEFELKLNSIHCFSTCIMSFNLFMHHIAFDLYLCANLQSALDFVFFSLFCCVFLVLILAPCLGKLELIGFPLLLLYLSLGFSFLRTIVVERLLRNWTVSVRFGLSVLWS